MPAGQSFAEADELKSQLGAEKTAESSGSTVESRDRLLGCTTITDAVAAFKKAKANERPRTLQAYSLTLKLFVEVCPAPCATWMTSRKTRCAASLTT